MGFRSARRSTTRESTGASGRITAQQQAAHREQSTGTLWTTDIDRGEQHFGMTVPDTRTLQRLQLHESTFGAEVHDWIAEGMPTESMGKPREMEAFRQRQADRPPAVPTNIERQNKRSVLRSKKAAAATGAAGETSVPASVRDVISSTGRSLDAPIQRAIEDRMGESLGDVRIHTGSQAVAACESINARAFTVGNHIAFNQGEYDPASPEGQHVLAHELAHVRQQTGGAVSMLPQDEVALEVDPDPQLEREAEETAQRVMQGGELGIQRLADTELHVQRLPDVEHLQQARERVEEESETMDLAAEVGRIKARLASVEQAVSGDSFGDRVGKATAKGAAGTVGGLLGGAAGTMLLPGLGTVGGAAFGTEITKGVAGDVTKTVTDTAYDKGSAVVDQMSQKLKAMVDERVKALMERFISGETGFGTSTGDAKSRR